MFAQPVTYTYIEPNPQLEADKKAKEAYFKRLRDDAFTNWTNCSKQCGSHAADANNPDPCGKSDPINVCLCACATKYQGAVSNIDKQEQDWLRTAAQRQKDWENKKVKEQQDELNKQTKLQQQQDFQKQQQAAAQDRLNQLQQQIDEQQRRYQQTQLDFANAQTAADNAYQAAIASGKKESGAMLDATLAASQQFNDPNAQLATLGVGLAASLFMHWGEKKQERLEREAALKREEERKQAIIDAKNKFITDAININKYGFEDLVSKSRYAALLLVRKNISSEQEEIYFTIPVLIPKYADSTYPLKDEIEKKLLKSLTLDRNQLANMKVYTLYPITDIKKFQNEFVKKMGSGHLIYLPAELIDFSNYPFNANNSNGETDFWGNPVKKENKNETNKSTKNDFWNN
ncbi:MAG: hypothetical protein JST17_11010 [Bacteroidetes bacterium]|nr:hypothetical protein [Bacteroidota bacterium]